MHSFKILFAIAVLLAVIIGAGTFINKSLEASSRQLEINIYRIEDAARNNEWEKAKAELESIKASWKKSQKSWAVIIDHAEIDNIENTVIRMAGFIESEDIPLTLGEAASLRQYIKHIPAKESFSLENIL